MLGLHGFFYIGVNCFVLLSGWYGIRLKFHRVLNLWNICSFYALAFLCTMVIYRLWRGLPCTFSWRMLLPVLMPFSHTPCWFIPCYVALMFFSPLLNAGLQNLNRQQCQWMLFGLSIMNLWFGYFCQERHINPTGHTVLQFIWLYVIGDFLHRYCTLQWCKSHRCHCLWVYVCGGGLWGIFSLMKAYHFLPGICDPLWRAFTYCNPLIMCSALGFFLFVMSFQFKCKAINWMAASVLPAYLVQETIFPYHRLQSWTENWSPLIRTLALPLFSIGWVVVVVLCDKIRLRLLFWHCYEQHFETRKSLTQN